MAWTVGMALALVYANNDYQILGLAMALAFMGLLGTSEENRLFSVIQWLIGVGYIVYVFYILAVKNYNPVILIVFSLIIMLIVAKRFKNETNEVDWL